MNNPVIFCAVHYVFIVFKMAVLLVETQAF